MGEVVYCLTNPAMVGYVKIGKTEDLSQRLKQLDNTSTPLPFECIYAIEVDDSSKVEHLLHDAFADLRTRRTREFFEISPERVISAMQLTGGRDVTPTDDTVEDQESQIALDKARTRRARFNFEMVGISPGTILQFHDDPEMTCTVLSNTKILFRDEETTLSRAAAYVIIERRNQQGEPIPEWLSQWAVQGPIYWAFNGESLDERRTRMEQGE
jgi:hypothetical protein